MQLKYLIIKIIITLCQLLNKGIFIFIFISSEPDKNTGTETGTGRGTRENSCCPSYFQ